MSEHEPGPSQSPYGQPSTPNPYGTQPSTPNPYGNPPYGAPTQAPYSGMGAPARSGGRPATVTTAAWVTIVLSGLVAVMFAFIAVMFVVARDEIITGFNESADFRESGLDPESMVGVVVAVMLGFLLWSVIAVVLGVFVLRRSGVARILLTISSAVVAVISLLAITSVVSAIWLIAAIAVIVLLYVGDAGQWFNETSVEAGTDGYAGGYPAGGGTNPYGQQTGSPTTQGDGTYYPPQDYPGR